jgi:hypothetical protein
MRTVQYLLALAGSMAALAACSAGGGGSGVFHNTGGGSSQGGGGSAASDGTGKSTGTMGQGGDIGFDGGPSGTGGAVPEPCNSGPDVDKDQDGWTIAQGDCNDCDPNVNPAAVEVIAKPSGDGGTPAPEDEDCDGKIDNVEPPCDTGLKVDDSSAMDGAKAIELCHPLADPKKWGLVSAKWTLPDGSPPPPNPNFDSGHGLLPAFGANVKVQAGQRMLAISSGTARQPTDPGYKTVGGFDKGYICNHPQGFPKESPACPGVTTGQPHDGMGLEVTVKAPSNAHGFSFYFNFYTYEWPSYICSQYNDFFVALLAPIPMGQTDGNISFDSQGNPVSVNNAFLEVCGCNPGPPCIAGNKSFPCSLGDKGLLGTGFKDQFTDHGSTGWLFSQAPVTPGEQITMRWAVYDSGDGILDSTTLVDNWAWIAAPGTEVGTGVVPTPK